MTAALLLPIAAAAALVGGVWWLTDGFTWTGDD